MKIMVQFENGFVMETSMSVPEESASWFCWMAVAAYMDYSLSHVLFSGHLIGITMFGVPHAFSIYFITSIIIHY